MAKSNGKREKKGIPGSGEVSNLAFIYWSEENKRYEMKIDNILKAYTKGETEEDHLEMQAEMKKLAEGKGYTVLVG